MNSENNFLKILNENKEDIELTKKIILNNKDIINKDFKINNNSEIFSPLTYCLEKKLSELSIFLIDQGANINYKTYPKEDYPLLIACRHGLEDVVKKLLLNDNININCLNKDNETCYTILLNNLNVTIYNLILDYVNQKKQKSNSNINNKIENKNNNNKKKIMINSLSLELPLEYKNNYINSKIGKFILFNIFYLYNIFFKFYYRGKRENNP